MVILINANHRLRDSLKSWNITKLSNCLFEQPFTEITWKRFYVCLQLSIIVVSQYAFGAKSYIVNASAVFVHERDCSHASNKEKITVLNVSVSRILKFGHLFMKTPENSCKQTRKTRNKRMDDNFSLEPPYSLLSTLTNSTKVLPKWVRNPKH